MPTRLIEQTSEDTHMYRVWNFLTNYSLLLIFGAIIALIWANIDYKSYHDFVEFKIWDHAPNRALSPRASHADLALLGQ